MSSDYERMAKIIAATPSAAPSTELAEVQRWRDDAFEAAAKIAERWGSTDAARDIRAMVSRPAALRPCKSPYCECEPGKCTHPGCYDARPASDYSRPRDLNEQNQFRDWLLDWSYCLPERAMSELESIFGDYIVPASAPETGRDEPSTQCPACGLNRGACMC